MISMEKYTNKNKILLKNVNLLYFPGFDVVQVRLLLILLHVCGETLEEITCMVKAMNAACNAVKIKSTGTKLLDIVRSSGDGANMINISTASVVLAVVCGCIIEKSGNQSILLQYSSTDMLEVLGVKVALKPEEVVK